MPKSLIRVGKCSTTENDWDMKRGISALPSAPRRKWPGRANPAKSLSTTSKDKCSLRSSTKSDRTSKPAASHAASLKGQSHETQLFHPYCILRVAILQSNDGPNG